VELPAFSPGANSPASDEPDNDNFDKPEEQQDVKESSPKGLVKNLILKGFLVAICHSFWFGRTCTPHISGCSRLVSAWELR
jgi:hypothetical protein